MPITPTLPPPRSPGNHPYRISFICTGNICRSPMAEVVLRALAGQARLDDGTTLEKMLSISSAGTGPWHVGDPMDERAATTLAAAGYGDHGHVAAHIKAAHLGQFDLVVGLDRSHLEALRGLNRTVSPERLVLLRSFDPAAGGAIDVPDPYYGDADDFTRCCDMVEAACRGLCAALIALLATAPSASTSASGPASASHFASHSAPASDSHSESAEVAR